MVQESRTHEEYLHRTREAVVARALELETIGSDEALKIEHTKLVYGVGDGSYRGVCHYEAWQNGIGKVDVVEIAAAAEESWIQLAGTTIHELAHVLAPRGAGHGSEWKTACERLGLRRALAAGNVYKLAQIDPKIREAVYQLAKALGDGRPEFQTSGWGLRGLLKISVRPCSAGIGARGGKSRGKGSGSRLRLWECDCEKPVKVRIASDDFAAHCDVCGGAFHKVEKTDEPTGTDPAGSAAPAVEGWRAA
jgi:hypothetical protein